jgi:hypothetical protein
MTHAQQKRLTDILDNLQALISDIEEDATDKGFMDGEDYARAEMDRQDIEHEARSGGGFLRAELEHDNV